MTTIEEEHWCDLTERDWTPLILSITMRSTQRSKEVT